MSRYSTKFAAALVLVLGLAGTSHAQETTTDQNIIRPITKQGSAAFLFTIQGLGTFGLGSPSFAGMTGVGAKWFLADNIALRTLLGFNSTSDKTTTGGTSTTLTTTGFGIGVGVEDHFRPLYSTSPYVGAVVSYGNTSADLASGGTDKTNEFGISAIAGFDWFFTRGMALGAEMGLGFTSTGGSTTNSAGTSTDKPSSTGIGLSTNGAVHWTVYF